MRFVYDAQIVAQPAAIRAVLGRTDVPALDPSRPVLFTGLGTSLHAARVAAGWVVRVSEGAMRAHAVDAHELAVDLPIRAGDQVVVVTHGGTRGLPGEVLVRARAAGATTVCVCGDGAPAPEADVTLRTGPREQAGTHTVSYVTALATLGRLVDRLVGRARLAHALAGVPEAMEAVLAQPPPVAAAERFAGCAPIAVAGTGLDAITADEAALKIKEGTGRFAEGFGVERLLHGPLSALGPGSGALVYLPSVADGGRTEALLRSLAALGVVTLTVGDGTADLPIPPVDPLVRPLVAVVPAQRLVAELARLLGTNPDEPRHERLRV